MKPFTHTDRRAPAPPLDGSLPPSLQKWGLPVTVAALLLVLWSLIIAVSIIQKQRLLDDSRKELAQLNSNSELTAIQIQSLVEQRKNALTLLSNLIAVNCSTLQSIIQNMKS